jgi:hypothetical protein
VLRSAHAAAKSFMWIVPPCRSASCHPRSILCCCSAEPGSGILASCPSGRHDRHAQEQRAGPAPLCRRMASTGCHPQISSASIESMENVDTTGSEISPALISTAAVRKYVFEVYLLWKSMQRTLRSKASDKKACLRRSFPHLPSREGLAFWPSPTQPAPFAASGQMVKLIRVITFADQQYKARILQL